MPQWLPAPAPERTPETEPFWSATRDGRLLLQHCGACGTVAWFPRAVCLACQSTDLEWRPASGRGTVYSFTVVHQGLGAYRDVVPFVVGYVELEEGPRVLTNIVGCEPGAVHIGQTVVVQFDDTGDGSALYRFRPLEP